MYRPELSFCPFMKQSTLYSDKSIICKSANGYDIIQLSFCYS